MGQAAGKGVEQFHQQFNDSKLSEIYVTAAPELKQGVQDVEFMKFITTVRRKLGAYQTGQQTGWAMNTTPGGTQVTVAYQSTFEHGSGVERFVFLVSGETAKLLGYHIDSRELMMNP